MVALKNDSLAILVIRLEYAGKTTNHRDHFYCGSVNLWRDFFTPEQLKILIGMEEGEQQSLAEGILLPADNSLIRTIHKKQWQPPGDKVHLRVPKTGRWYPQGFVSGVGTIFKQTVLPMRIAAVEDNSITIDCNHPLAGLDMRVIAEVEHISSQVKERGGRCTDWLEEAMADGPGMQIIRGGMFPDFKESAGYGRANEQNDAAFYSVSRFVSHVDDQAKSHLMQLTDDLLSKEMRVLDLMSSVDSHLTPGPKVVGLGMNENEMRKNPALSEWMVHDVNLNSELPFSDASFDAVCCHMSVEYLIDPQNVMAEVARVIRPGGRVIISFSNRWFPEKVTHLWKVLHGFERLSFVLTLLQNHFSEFVTTTFRNWPRPADDPHYYEVQHSDPLYIVSAVKPS